MRSDLILQVRKAFPDLAGQMPMELGQGFDSLALLFGDQVVRVALGGVASALQQEAALLAYVAPRVELWVPLPQFHPGPPAMSRHRYIAGTALDGAVYATLTELQRDRLADDLAQFHLETHQMDAAALRSLGAGPVKPWPNPADAMIAALPPDLRPAGQNILTRWQDLPPDPLGQVWGHFDAHGWNMAFDPETRRLNGIFDFGDSGFGDVHRDLIYSALVSPDLTRRLGRAYGARAGVHVDLERLRILAGAHRLWELAAATTDTRAWLIGMFRLGVDGAQART